MNTKSLFLGLALAASILTPIARSADVIFPMYDVGIYDVSQANLISQGNAFMRNREYAKARQSYDAAIAHDAKC